MTHPVDSWCAANRHICTSYALPHDVPYGGACTPGRGDCQTGLFCVPDDLGGDAICQRGAVGERCRSANECSAAYGAHVCAEGVCSSGAPGSHCVLDSDCVASQGARYCVAFTCRARL